MAREPFAVRLTGIWIGAIFFFICNGFRGKLKQQLQPKYESRNFWAGYLISVLGLVAVIYFFFIKPKLLTGS